MRITSTNVLVILLVVKKEKPLDAEWFYNINLSLFYQETVITTLKILITIFAAANNIPFIKTPPFICKFVRYCANYYIINCTIIFITVFLVFQNIFYNTGSKTFHRKTKAPLDLWGHLFILRVRKK